jgi:hypothetical protein
MNKYLGFGLIVFFLGLTSCASYGLKYAKQEKEEWQERQLPDESKLEHAMFLIGDAGNSPKGNPALDLLKEKLSAAPESSSVFFLGDNIYPGGMPPRSEPSKRLDAEKRLLAQLETLEAFPGTSIFLPGNHDHDYYGIEGVLRQEEFVEAYLNQGIDDEDDWENHFLPDNGCSGPDLVELSENVVAIVANSEWWLLDWDAQPDINYGCEAKTRGYFIFLLEELIRKYRTKNLVLVMHHPLESYGPHGGAFTLKEHIFPLTELEDNLFIPLPGIGSIAAFLRNTMGLRQDLSNPLYQDLRKKVLAGARKNGEFIYAGGHEHSLQLIEKDGQYFIGTGAGSKKTPNKLGKNALFAYANYGFSQLNFYQDGSAWVIYWSINEETGEGRMVFKKKIKDKLPLAESENEERYEEYEKGITYKIGQLTNYEIEARKGFVHNALLGRHFRHLYAAEYQVPALDLSSFEGGLTPVKIGGGGQTNSLRLEDPEGRQYAMRAITKDASRFLPYPFNKVSAAQVIVKDNFLGAHPGAAIVIPEMASACNVFHTMPEWYYVPKQPALKQYNEYFGGEMYLLEERPNNDWKDHPSFGGFEKVLGTPDLLEKLRKNYKNQVDQKWVARSRVFDLLIGDWDRHDDQWRWARFDREDGVEIYRPIPRDRDQAFCKYDGLIGAITKLSMPFLKQVRSYSPQIKNIKWSTYNGRQFDRTFLSELSWEEWKEQAIFVQDKLTDEVITRAFSAWPEEIKDESYEEILENLKSRRDAALDIARMHYLNVAKESEVIGTNDRDLFEVSRKEDGSVEVGVYHLTNKGKVKEKYFERTYFPKETKEIRLFGLEDDDRFVFSGNARKSILVRAIGGEGEDLFQDSSRVAGLSRKTKVYDTKEGNALMLGKEGKDLTTDLSKFNQYHRRDMHYEYDFLTSLPMLGFNPDDGLFLGATFSFTNYKFKKAPFASKNTFSGQYAFATGAYDLRYKGEFMEAVGKWDLLLEGVFQGPKFVQNFFGLGNNSVNPLPGDKSLEVDFYRVRQSRYAIAPGLRKRFDNNAGTILFSPFVERITVQENLDRFVVSEEAGLPRDIFNPRYFAGSCLQVNFENVDSRSFPTRGIKVGLGGKWRANLEEFERNFLRLNGDIAIYQALTNNEAVVLALRAGIIHNTSDKFDFFHAAKLGGNSNLRGFRAQRFYGKTAFFHNADLRVKVIDSDKSLFPTSIGFSAGLDGGRVWSEADDEVEDPAGWQLGYGGGLWVAPYDVFLILGEYFVSDEDERFSLRLNFSF